MKTIIYSAYMPRNVKRKDILPMVVAGAAVASAAAVAHIEANTTVKIADLIDPNHGADDFAIELHRGKTREIAKGARVPKSASIVYVGEDDAWSDSPITVVEKNTVKFCTESAYHTLEYVFKIENITEGTLKGKLVNGKPVIEFEAEQDIQITVDFEEMMNPYGVERYFFHGYNWFEHDNNVMFLYYSDRFFDKPSTTYSPQLMTFALNLELAACTESKDISQRSISIQKLLRDIGCDNIYINDIYTKTPSIRSTDVAIGSKKYEGYNIIFLVLNGAHYSIEFASNVMIGREGDHKGFSLSKDAGMDALKEFISQYGINGRTKLLITGYSRTAAGANLLSRDICDAIAEGTVFDKIGNIELTKEDVYGLCFETPLCGFYQEGSGMTNPNDPRYDNIWYTTNPDDPVTYVPTKMYGFVRYGNRIILNPDHDENMNRDMLANIAVYVGKRAVSFYDMSKFRAVGGLRYMEDVNVGFVEKFFNALGTREFYKDIVEDDFVNMVYVSRTKRAVLKDIVWDYGGFINFIRDLYDYHNDYDQFVEVLTPHVQAATSRYDCEEFTDNIVNAVFQILGVIDRYCKGNIIKFLTDNYLRTMIINPGRVVKTHYPAVTLSYLMLEDPNYPKPLLDEVPDEMDAITYQF